MGLLSLAIWIPIAFGVLLLAIGRDENAGMVRMIALVGSVVSFLVTLPLISGFDNGTAALQFVEKLAWIERFNVQVPPGRRRPVGVVRAAHGLHHRHRRDLGWEVITEKVGQYMGAFLILSGLMVGVFARSTACCSTSSSRPR
jgi:NADH-quinone oxidoreductase subunit M